MAEQDLLAESEKAEELKRQERYLATAFAEAVLKERSLRSGQLDEVRFSIQVFVDKPVWRGLNPHGH